MVVFIVMNDLVTIVNEIELKARKLANTYQDCKTRNELLVKQNQQLLEEVNALRMNIKKLEYSKHIIKIAKVLEKERGSTEAKKLINGLLREVDLCIGLLND
jgi:cell division protein FtsB